jgi:hypothetical protein
LRIAIGLDRALVQELGIAIEQSVQRCYVARMDRFDGGTKPRIADDGAIEQLDRT